MEKLLKGVLAGTVVVTGSGCFNRKPTAREIEDAVNATATADTERIEEIKAIVDGTLDKRFGIPEQGDGVMYTPTPTATATPTPRPTETHTAAAEQVEEEVVWSDDDAFDATETEYPMGNEDAWVYAQSWDGSNTETVRHYAVAPGLVLRVDGHVGTRWHIWGDLPTDRLEEMTEETADRDGLEVVPEVIVIEDKNDPNMSMLPESWVIQEFPKQ